LDFSTLGEHIDIFMVRIGTVATRSL
jgi:hypothetical protein